MLKLYYTIVTPDALKASAAEKQPAAALTAAEHRLGRRLLIRVLTENGLEGVDETWLDQHLVIGPHEKPELPDGTGLCFNISHSDGLVVCALSDTQVGVDAETIGHHTEVSIFRRVLADSEKQWITDAFLPPLSGDRREVITGQRLEAFMRIWTLKESHIKYDGQGLFMTLTDIAFRTEDIKKAMEQSHGFSTIHSSAPDLVYYQTGFFEKWFVSVCTACPQPVQVICQEAGDL